MSITPTTHPKHINRPVFERGYAAFFNGGYGEANLDYNQRQSVVRRSNALLNKDHKTAMSIQATFKRSGIVLTDKTEQFMDGDSKVTRVVTTALHLTVADNPYKAGILQREWQRGFDTAYFHSQRGYKNEVLLMRMQQAKEDRRKEGKALDAKLKKVHIKGSNKAA